MTVRYSNAQLQQQRDLPGAGVRREAVSLSQLTWMQKFIARDTNLNAGETGPVISGDFGPRDPIGKMLTKSLGATLDECLGRYRASFWFLAANRGPWRPHADQIWHETSVPQYTVLIPLTAGARTCVFHQRVLDPEPWGRKSQSKNPTNYQIETRPQESAGYEGHGTGYAFTPEHHASYYSHTDYQWFEGLTVDMEYEWHPGDIIWWPMCALHCSDNHVAQGIPVKYSIIMRTWFV